MRSGRTIVETVWAVGALAGVFGGGAALLHATQVPTTVNDFFIPGTQPMTLSDPIVESSECMSCHAFYDEEHEPGLWAGSMKAQSARDPLFLACLTIANQDAAFAGDLCLRCHTPSAWLAGRSTPTDGSGLTEFGDTDGVNCNLCHRMVNPTFVPGESPPEDMAVLAALTDPPPNPHSGSFVIDPFDRRRGPFDLGPDFFFHDWLQSAFHQDSALCATCHDVSNPVYERQPDGTYVLGALDTPNISENKYDQFPVERTYSEWLNSDFATAPIDMGGRFGGANPFVSSCQDCHMPDANAAGCFITAPRPDMPLHFFNGGNNWVLRAVDNLYPDGETRLTPDLIEDSIARAEQMLADASDLELYRGDGTITSRIVNQTGHKLPTGYPEGRRMWINVRFLDAKGVLISEFGAYDDATAVLSTAGTKVYEGKLGVDAAVSSLTGVPEGESFHFALNNVWIKDNRIPPRGFTNASFQAIQAAPVGATYDDGQYWDDTEYAVPAGAATAEVRVWYQVASKEYIEFLRDENVTDTRGDVLYQQWELLGKSPPALMDFESVDLTGCLADINTLGTTNGKPDGVVNLSDLQYFLNEWQLQTTVADFNTTGTTNGVPDGDVNLSDLQFYLNQWQDGLTACP